MATLMTIRQHTARTRTEQATFEVLAAEAPVIDPEGMAPGQLQTLTDKVITDGMEEPTIYAATDLIAHLHTVWGMDLGEATLALANAAGDPDGEHYIVHI